MSPIILTERRHQATDEEATSVKSFFFLLTRNLPYLFFRFLVVLFIFFYTVI